jgi:hypothetical protein
VARLRDRALRLTAAQAGADLLPTVIPGIREILGVPDSTAEINARACPEWAPASRRIDPGPQLVDVGRQRG